jgi:hypothetical protein
MPKWAKEEACFREAVVYDFITKKIVPEGGLRWFDKSIEQKAYEDWLSLVTNKDTGQFHPQRDEQGNLIERDEEGNPIPIKTARHVIDAIYRVRDAKGNEYLLSKGNLIGHDGWGHRKDYYCKFPERWHKSAFLYKPFNEDYG